MSLSIILDVILGITFVFLVLSAIASTIHEIISVVLNWRAKDLENGISALLSQNQASAQASVTGVKPFAERVLAHPLLRRNPAKTQSDKTAATQEQGEKTISFPTYIPTNQFTAALIRELAIERKQGEATVRTLNLSVSGQELLNELKTGIENLQDTPLKQILQTLYLDAMATKQDAESFRKAVGEWFNNAMDQISNQYKRNAQLTLGVIGLVIAITLNADAVNVMGRLWRDPTVREAIAAQAQGATPPEESQPQSIDQLGGLIKKLQDQYAEGMNLPIGWTCEEFNDLFHPPAPNTGDGNNETAPPCNWDNLSVNPQPFASKIFGWLIMAVAISFGAPFWFDLINKITPFRVKPNESP